MIVGEEMKRTYTWLAALLLAQLTLAAGLYWSNAGREREPAAALLPVAVADIDRIAIEGKESTVTLQRQKGEWRLSKPAQLRADQLQVAGALDKLAAISTQWPVATTPSSQQQLEVADSDFQRHLRLFSDGELVADFYLGSSPGFRQVHLRNAGSDAIHVIKLGVNDLPDTPDAWLDRTLLAVAQPTRLEGPDFVLSSVDSAWSLQNGDVDESKVADLVAALADLRVQSIGGDTTLSEQENGNVFRLRVETPEAAYDYLFFDSEGQHYAQRSDINALFGLSQYDYDRIAGVNREALVAVKAAGQEEVAGADTGLPGDEPGAQDTASQTE